MPSRASWSNTSKSRDNNFSAPGWPRIGREPTMVESGVSGQSLK